VRTVVQSSSDLCVSDGASPGRCERVASRATVRNAARELERSKRLFRGRRSLRDLDAKRLARFRVDESRRQPLAARAGCDEASSISERDGSATRVAATRRAEFESRRQSCQDYFCTAAYRSVRSCPPYARELGLVHPDVNGGHV